jgi:hypothetical protein
MGGKSSSTQSTSQSQTTAPWEAAQPFLNNVLGQLNTQMGNTGLTGAETNALNAIETNAGQNASNINGLVGNLMAGGGATDQANNLNKAYTDYQTRLAPTADGQEMGANSGLKAYLDTIMNDVQGQVNGQFAAAGRDFSGMNQQTLARGFTQAAAPVIANQYNTDVQNRMNAANSLYGAGVSNAQGLAGLQQQKLANQQAGVQLGESTNYGQNAILNAEAARRNIPLQSLGLLAQIGIPIAGLGSQTTGTSSTQKNDKMSGAQQFGLITGGLSKLWGG